MAAIAEFEGLLESHTEAKAADEKELAGTLEVIASLHAECDWLLKYFDVRKDARASEIDALGRAKAVLSGGLLASADQEGAPYAEASVSEGASVLAVEFHTIG